MKDEMIGAKEVAEMMGIGDVMVRTYFRAGKFKTAQKLFGTRWHVSKKEVQDILDGKIDVDFSGATADARK